MLSVVVFLAVLSVLILVHEFGHFIAARRVGVRVEKFSLGFGPRLFSVKRGDTEYVVSAFPLGGYVKMAGETIDDKITGSCDEYVSKTAGQRLAIVGAGPLLNYIFAILVFCLVFVLGNPTISSKVGKLIDDFPAISAGIQEGDRIVAVDGKDVKYWEDIINVVHKKIEQDVVFTIDRQGQSFDLTLRPKVQQVTDIFGKEHKIGLVGIMPSDEVFYVKSGIIEAIKLSVQRVIKLTYMTYLILFKLITGGLAAKDTVAGPIGIFMIVGNAAKMGIVYLLMMLAHISASLAIFNLLPIPVLDGGHIVFLLWEKISGKPVSKRFQEITNQAGMVLLLLFVIFVCYNDAVRAGWIDKIIGIFR